MWDDVLDEIKLTHVEKQHNPVFLLRIAGNGIRLTICCGEMSLTQT